MRSLAQDLGEPQYRGEQLYHWIYRKQVPSLDEMVNLPKSFRTALSEGADIGRQAPMTVADSADGTKKYLFPITGGAVESALIPDGQRLTLCLSTQIGCRRGCIFCQTGRQGFHGNLSAGEIVNQHLSLPERDAVTNIVFMGMGEPLDNPGETLAALELLTDAEGIGLTSKRITLSTVGIHPALEQFLDATTVNLAVSMHSPFPDERRRLMSVEAAHPLASTLDLIRDRREDRRRKVSMEYTVFGNLNATPAHAKEVARLLGGLSARVNLIAYHPLVDAGGLGGYPLRPPSTEEMLAFQRELRERGIRTFIRKSRGQDIGAACGMLWTAGAHGNRGPGLEIEPLSADIDG